MQVNFWGVRGSYPCWGEGKDRIGGQTACVSVSMPDREAPLIFDMGTGIIDLGRDLLAQGIKDISIVVSHFHLDHVMGLPFFKPLWDRETTLTFYAVDPNGSMSLENLLKERLFCAPLFPVPFDQIPATCHLKTVNPGEEIELAEGVILKSIPLNHPGSATGYRVQSQDKSFCYMTDHEQSVDFDATDLISFVKDADLMLCDTMYSPSDMPSHTGWRHSSWQNAVDVAQQAGVKKLALFHTSPEYNDDDLLAFEAAAHDQFKGAFLAREGTGLEL